MNKDDAARSMTMPNNLGDILRAEEQRKLAQAAAIKSELQKGVIPTSEPVVRALVYRIDHQELMRSHTYATEHQIRLGFNALISAAVAAHVGLSSAEATLTAFAQTRDPFDGHIKHTVENPAQKELIAFCAAYVGTIDTLRRLESRRPDIWPQIDELRKSTTGSEAFRFIFELRKNLSHGSVVVPYWNIATDDKGTNGNMHFSARELLAFGDWKSEGRKFLRDRDPDSFAITSITAQCAEGLAKFRRELELLFARNRSDAENDYNAILALARRVNGSSFAKLILNQAVLKGVDPYAHLHRFFSPEETVRILQYPPHSEEQVKFVIRLKESTFEIDDRLCSLIYQLFQVPIAIDVENEAPSIDPKPLGNLWPHSK